MRPDCRYTKEGWITTCVGQALPPSGMRRLAFASPFAVATELTRLPSTAMYGAPKEGGEEIATGSLSAALKPVAGPAYAATSATATAQGAGSKLCSGLAYVALNGPPAAGFHKSTL